MKFPVICIGTSAGGVTAVRQILKRLPSNFPAAILVAQHFPADADIDYHLIFGENTKVRDVYDKIPLEAAGTYFGPPGYHLQVEKDLTLSLSQDEPVNFARPSIDVLFETAAWALGKDAMGILLTGANSDGAKGLKVIQDAGGITMVQDPEEAESAYMPESALECLTPDFVLKLDEIADKMAEIAGRNE